MKDFFLDSINFEIGLICDFNPPFSIRVHLLTMPIPSREPNMIPCLGLFPAIFEG